MARVLASARAVSPPGYALAEKAGWGKPAAQGVHRGLAQFMGFNSYTAAVAEISMKNNNLRSGLRYAANACGSISRACLPKNCNSPA
jgi:hypothetical protein